MITEILSILVVCILYSVNGFLRTSFVSISIIHTWAWAHSLGKAYHAKRKIEPVRGSYKVSCQYITLLWRCSILNFFLTVEQTFFKVPSNTNFRQVCFFVRKDFSYLQLGKFTSKF